ncbi:MAG: TRAP transporter substrate-binding protein DctP [Spirochaetales bacterium]|nr:TRAP transporter substrate-binding protein DctP [Spirochaetales bacterium]
MKKILLILFVLIIAVSTVSGITIKMASPVPEDSEWHRAFSEMAREWSQITRGAVKIRIYPGGIAGSGVDVVRKMRIGQVDMAVLTSPTIATIVPDSFVMTMPFYLQSEGELDHVLSEMSHSFDNEFEEKGFKMLSWSKSGWLNIFANKEITTPDELRRIKFAVSPDDQKAINAYKDIGFNVIPLDLNDLLMGLQSGMIDSFYTSPLAAASYQLFAVAPYMLNYRIAPLIGGIMISERTWKRIPARYHEELQASVERMTSSLHRETVALEERAFTVMEANGLQRVDITAAQTELWNSVLGEDFSSFVGEGKVISSDIFARYQDVVEGYRNNR